MKRALTTFLSVALALLLLDPAGAMALDGSSQPNGSTAATTSGIVSTLSVQSAEEATGIAATDEGTAYASGEVLVTFKDGTTRDEATRAVQDVPAVSTDEVGEDNLVATDIEGDTLVSDTEGVAPEASAPMAKVDVAEGSTVVQAVAELEQDDSVASAQPNYLYALIGDDQGERATSDVADTLAQTVAENSGTAVTTQSTTSINDPYFTDGSLWQLNGTAGVDAATAWNTTKCDGTVSVAIVDTGIQPGHADLAANVKDTYVASGATSLVNEAHGTHVAGLVSAVTNNGVGVSGVSYNAGLVICKADNSNGSFSDESLLDAYSHIMSVRSTYNIKVINMSLGGQGSCSSDDALLGKVDAAYDAGIVTVCAAGNSGSRLFVPYAEYPGDYATCVSVINTTSSGTRSYSSNYNQSGSTAKNVAAPGTSLYSTYNSNLSPYQSYYKMSGTSMASPVVAGLMALEFAEDSSLTPSEAKGVLYKTAAGGSSWSTGYGYGIASAAGAVDAIIGTNDVTLSQTSFVYTRSAITPDVTVTTASGTTLAKGTDYTVSYSNNVNVGTASVTITGTGSYSCSGNTATGSGYIGSVTKTFEITGGLSMYRLYNPSSGEHFFTSNATEKAGLIKVGWTYEGVAWTAPSSSSTPVYRLYNKNGGEHHYTMSSTERASLVALGWTYEGVGWYSDDAKATPLYRLYNPNAYANNHHYTANASERDWLKGLGWRYEGIGWYGL